MTDEKQPDPQRLILVVDDDASFRRMLVRTFETAGYPTRDAENGLAAKSIFDLNADNIQLVISDVSMPVLDGIQLLKHVRKYSNMPFVLMTGFAEILEAKKAHELGATDFVPKPFRRETLFDCLDRCLHPEKHTEQEKKDPTVPSEKPQYCPVHIDEFISTSILQSDIYVKLSEEKYIKIAYKGDQVSVERLRVYKEKKVEYLYVTLADFNRYVEFNIKLTDIAIKTRNVPRDKKALLLRHTTEIIVEKCFLDKLDEQMVRPAQRMIEDTLSMVTNNPKCWDLISGLGSQSDRLYAHGVAVSLFSCMVAQQHGWFAAQTLFKISIGGLLHDIGKKELDPSVYRKSRLSRTADETKILETHPVRGRDLILQVKSLPEDVAMIVYQHHEMPTGIGYPSAIKSEGIHPLARLVGTVDRFADLAVPIADDAEQLTPHDAIDRILRFSPDTVDMAYFKRIMQIFKFDESACAKEKSA